MVQTYTVKMENMEVRKVEEVVLEIGDKEYPRLQVHFDNEDCDRLVFTDKVLDRKEVYKRGTIGTLTLSICTEATVKTSKNGKPYIGEKTKIEIEDFVVEQ